MHSVRGGLEPDSGNPTVRDHWGALGNTTMEELGTRSTIERVETETLFLRCCAPSFYPDRSCDCEQDPPPTRDGTTCSIAQSYYLPSSFCSSVTISSGFQ